LREIKSKLGISLTAIILTGLLILSIDAPWSRAQQQQSGGGGSSVSISAALPSGANVVGKVGIDQTTPGTTNLVSIGSNGTVGLLAGANLVGKVGIDQTTPGTTNGVQVNAALPAGANVIGHVINDASSAVIGHVIADSGSTTAVTALPALAAGTNNIGFVRTLASPCTQSTNFTLSTAGVATGAGTSVTSTTTCITKAYANNITNSAVTFRLADKTGTPIIWVGGNADFTIPANSNVSFPLEGVTMTGGITAIAGTASAINLQISGVQ
jgi:hypothetical protein